MNALHFLRPAWFLALIPLAALIAVARRRRRADRGWRAAVDPRLLPHLLIGGADRRGPWPLAAAALGGLLAVVALAGPAWSKLQQPVFRREAALVVLLDLSRSMDAGDLRPSRLQMAKFKLRDLLARRKEGETALIVYAADPYAVTPLTDDTDTIARQLPSLTTDLMPAQGSRADRAVAKGLALLQQAGAVRGDLLLITDGVDNDAPASLREAVKKTTAAGYRLSVLGVGSADGAPIPLAGGGFLKDDGGAIVLPKLDENALARLAAEGGGIYRRLAADDSDTDAFAAVFDRAGRSGPALKMAAIKSDQWREEGPWLLLPLLPLAALAFRRGYLLALCLTLLLPLPHRAYAYDWGNLWQRPDQRGAQALAARQPQLAAKLFEDPQWRAAAHYRAGDYRSALQDLAKQHDAAADYNRGDALAHLGKLQEALSAYDEALKLDPDLKDAAYNRDLVKQWLQARQNPPASAQGRQGKAQKPQRGGSAQPQQDGRQSGAHAQQRQPSSAQANAGRSGSPATPQNAARDGNAPGARRRQNDRSTRERNDAAARNAQPSRQNPQHERNAANALQPQMAGATAAPRSESEQADAQWLRRIPDDPGGLWRRKFLYQYKQQYQAQQSEARPW